MWSGSELFAEALPQLAAYIPITLLCFAVPSLVALFMGSLICYIRVGKKKSAVLSGQLVCVLFPRHAWAYSDIFVLLRSA